MYPNHQESFLLNLLLHTARVPTSFTDFRRHNEEACSTYNEACAKHGLLEDDAHWDQILEETAVSRAPSQLHQLFSIMLMTCRLSDPLKLWVTYKTSMVENILQRIKNSKQTSAENYNETLDIQAQDMEVQSNLACLNQSR